MAPSTLTVRVVSPEETVFSGEASGLVAPAWDGKVGILPGHAPMITLLGAGELAIDSSAGAQLFHIAGGLIKVEANQVTVLTEYASDEPAPADLVLELIGSSSASEGTSATAANSASVSV
jgi:F-type H+-transporting ATPase subunit epsilon